MQLHPNDPAKCHFKMNESYSKLSNSLIIIEFILSRFIIPCYPKTLNLLDEESSNAISSKGGKIQLYMHNALGCSLMITRRNER